MTQDIQSPATINVDDDVTPIKWERTYNRDGKVLNLIPGGYEVRWENTNTITYENDRTIELRYPDE